MTNLYCNEVKYPISVGIVPLSEFPENLLFKKIKKKKREGRREINVYNIS